jgi:hypothetical protein
VSDTVPAAHSDTSEDIGKFAHDLFVVSTENNCPHTIIEDFFDSDDLADTFGPSSCDDVQTLVENDLRSTFEQLEIDLWMKVHPHLSTAGQNIHRFVVVLSDNDAIGRRWLGKFVDLFSKTRDVLASISQRCREPIVLGDLLSEQTLGLEKPFFQLSETTRCIGQAATKYVDFVEARLPGGLIDLMVLEGLVHNHSLFVRTIQKLHLRYSIWHGGAW